MAERSGFEPENRFKPVTHLAGGRFRPLSHLSEEHYIRNWFISANFVGWRRGTGDYRN